MRAPNISQFVGLNQQENLTTGSKYLAFDIQFSILNNEMLGVCRDKAMFQIRIAILTNQTVKGNWFVSKFTEQLQVFRTRLFPTLFLSVSRDCLTMFFLGIKMKLLLCLACIAAVATLGGTCNSRLAAPIVQMETENERGICVDYIHELAFKSSFGCTKCITDFCVKDNTVSLEMALKDENDCNKALDCIRAHSGECGCLA